MAEPLQILLVEDGPTDAQMFTHAVEQTRAKVHVHAVPDAMDGREYLTGRGLYGDRVAFPFPDLVVLELLQDNSGLDFLQWCRKHPAATRLPLLVLTRAAENDSRVDQALAYGATDVFFKPGHLSGLRQIVQEMLGSLDAGPQSHAE